MKRERLVLSFYGDDFTGSTDVMEALSVNGLRTALFFRMPTSALLQQFPHLDCFGVAGVGRSLSVAGMEELLPAIFRQLQAFGTPIVHYKICSTFDSSPEIGSIGKAIDIGREVFREQPVIPLLVGVPILKRYTVFGQLFASVGTRTYRLDRHPTMSKHPITPMKEADLRVHLARQTDSRISLMDVVQMNGEMEEVHARYKEILSGERPDVLLFDVLDDEHLRRAGQLIWQEAARGQRFVVGSSGVEYALAAHWAQAGLIASGQQRKGAFGKADRLIALSGSCSPVTMRQIQYALNEGFEGLKVPVDDLLDEGKQEETKARIYAQALRILEDGGSPLIYTAFGPDDSSIDRTKRLSFLRGWDSAETGKIIASHLGRVVRRLLERTDVRRLLIAGGDTSGYAAQELGLYGMEMIAPISPGGPLCRAFSDQAKFHGLEVALKGGQVGEPDYFVSVRDGIPN